jgi:heterotetrameric sarcosine oxidase delta subunit
MRLNCPICGERDLREFTYQGDAVMLSRPDAEADSETWSAWLHLRDNPAGRTRELWYHEAGCCAWLVVERDTTTHAVLSVDLVETSDAD